MADSNPPTAAAARTSAQEWVQSQGFLIPGFGGAWLAGSVAWLAPQTPVQPWSDVDVMVVLNGATPPKIGKLLHGGVLLEVSFVSAEDCLSVATMESNYRLSASFARGLILSDPTGMLTGLQQGLMRRYDEPPATLNRMEQSVRATAAGLAGALDNTGSLASRAQWVFPAGLPTHVAILAEQGNPTVRRRYEVHRTVMEEWGRIDLHEQLLQATGYGAFSQEDVLAHWRATVRLFDLASPVSVRSTAFFASDISEVARPISIDGTANSIADGFHRETVFWLVVTQARAMMVLEEVAPHLITDKVRDSFGKLLDDIGIVTREGMVRRTEAVLDLVPDLMGVARAVVLEQQTRCSH